jgi:hypothetical protein
MGFRFRRTWGIIPGVRLNLGMKSGSVSFGVRGFHYTVGTRGQILSVHAASGSPRAFQAQGSSGQRKLIRRAPHRHLNSVVRQRCFRRNRRFLTIRQVRMFRAARLRPIFHRPLPLCSPLGPLHSKKLCKLWAVAVTRTLQRERTFSFHSGLSMHH